MIDLHNRPEEQRDWLGLQHHEKTQEEKQQQAEGMMNRKEFASPFDLLKEEIKKNYPPLKSLSILNRIKAYFFGSSSEYRVEIKNDKGLFIQYAVLRYYKGQGYLKKFGRLHPDQDVVSLDHHIKS